MKLCFPFMSEECFVLFENLYFFVYLKFAPFLNKYHSARGNLKYKHTIHDPSEHSLDGDMDNLESEFLTSENLNYNYLNFLVC